MKEILNAHHPFGGTEEAVTVLPFLEPAKKSTLVKLEVSIVIALLKTIHISSAETGSLS